MRRWRLAAIAAASFAAVGGLAVVSGIVPIAASSGHWPVTASFLHFAMRRSVATHSLGQEVPSLDAPWLAQKGAAHYEAACRSCHGSPDHPPPVIARHMTPPPPDLARAVPAWEPAELFYIVKHGVKLTGMPAWPAQKRDDEVWAMVAFLRRLPGLDAHGYRVLVHGAATAGPDTRADRGPHDRPPGIVHTCEGCHGPDGRGRGGPAFPILAGQRPAYLLGALQAYARAERHSGIMGPVAGSLRVEEMRQIADYYGGLTRPANPRSPLSEARIQHGEDIARRGIPPQRVPACVACHGPGTTPLNPSYPILAGQYSEYLVLQLELIQAGRRGGSPYARLMHPVASRLTREQMQAVGLYYESLDSATTPDPR
jgi:cytochrome c553